MSDDKAALACCYAALILHDDGVEVSAEKINTILAAAKVEIPGFWAGVFANVLAKHDISKLIAASVSVGGGAGPAGGAAGGAAGDAPAEEEKEEEEEEEADFGGGGLFGDDEDDDW